jgi:hypothetical protein
MDIKDIEVLAVGKNCWGRSPTLADAINIAANNGKLKKGDEVQIYIVPKGTTVTPFGHFLIEKEFAPEGNADFPCKLIGTLKV